METLTKYTTNTAAIVDNISDTLLRNDHGFLLCWQQEICGWTVITLCRHWHAKAHVQCFIARTSSAVEF